MIYFRNQIFDASGKLLKSALLTVAQNILVPKRLISFLRVKLRVFKVKLFRFHAFFVYICIVTIKM